MIDAVTLGVGLGLALLGGLLIALSGRQWCLCPHQHCPMLEPGQKVELTVEGERYATIVAVPEGETLLLIPPLQRGLPLSFEFGTFAEMRLTTPAGIFEAIVQFVGREVKPEPRLRVRLASRWSHSQRRRYERIPLPDEVSVALQRADEQWIGWARDVSMGGLRLIAPVSVPVNAQVRLELPRALRGLTDSDAERTARVVACERAPTRHGYAYQLRLAFVND
ncbi:MAG: flagellar brake protein [Fimbriimonadales bacterium]|nr:flagellar brake protein [Fimbriimonadales bacterium]